MAWTMGGGNIKSMKLSKEQKQAAAALGIKKVNKQDELNRINNYVSAAQQSRSNPVYQQSARNLGITNYNSVRDYAQVVNAMAAPRPAAPAQAATPVQQDQPQQQQPATTPTTTSAPAPAPAPITPRMPDFGAMMANMQAQMQAQIAEMQAQSQAQMQEVMQMYNQQLAASEKARAQEMERLKETQKVYAMNQARADAAGNLQIQGADSAMGIGGTDAFKIRNRANRFLEAAAPLMLSTTLNI